MIKFSEKRILIVEDNAFVGEMVGEMLREADACPVGPVITEAEALDMIDYDTDGFDAVILDLNLDRKSVGIAARLHDLRVPFVFATGRPDDVPPRFSHVPMCAKPYTIADLHEALHAAFDSSPTADKLGKPQAISGHRAKLVIVTQRHENLTAD